MSLSKEILKRLNSENEPLPKRLKLAETAITSVDTPFFRQDLILNWLCELCETNQRAIETLKFCILHMSTVNILNRSAKKYLLDILKNQTITKTPFALIILTCDLMSCCKTLEPEFMNKPSILGNIIYTYLMDLLKRYDEQPNETQVEECNENTNSSLSLREDETEYLIKSIENIILLYKRAIHTKEEIKSIFINDILWPLCQVINIKNSETIKINTVAHKCIKKVLLENKKRNKENTEDKAAIFADLFHQMSIKMKLETLKSNILTYTFVFCTVVNTYKSDVVMVDIFFRNLIESAGEHKWEILSSFLEILKSVTLDFENVIDGISLSEYFQRWINDILTSDNVTSNHCKILQEFSYVNPHLIEKNIPQILNKISMEEENVEYTKLLLALLYASIKLRREQKFISQLLISLKKCATKQKETQKSLAFFKQIVHLDCKLKEKLENLMLNIPNAEGILILKTLIYHLNTDCIELLKINLSHDDALILKTTVELLVIVLKNIQFFKFNGTDVLHSHEKFVNTIDELGNVLTRLINKAMCLNYDKNIIITLLTAVDIVSEIQDILKHYLPEIANALLFPIQDESWYQLIQRICNFGEDDCKFIMNKLILRRLKKTDEIIEPHKLIGGIDYSWNVILKYYSNMLISLNMNEIYSMTYLLLMDMLSTSNKFKEWLDILKEEECIQENIYFVECFWQHIFYQIKRYFSLECTSFVIIEHIEVELFMEDKQDIYKSNRLTEILRFIKERISQQQWTQIKFDFDGKFASSLKILHHLPIIYLNSDVKNLIFMVLYSISQECHENKNILKLCSNIFYDLISNTGVDVFKYIEPTILINQLEEVKLPTTAALRKACAFSLRSVTSYATLKNLIDNSDQSNHNIKCIIAELLEHVKPTLNSEQIIIFNKAENYIAEVIMKLMEEEQCPYSHTTCLYTALKVTHSTGRITDFLKKNMKLFFKEKFDDYLEDDIYLMHEAISRYDLDIVAIALKSPKIFALKEKHVTMLWYLALQYPHTRLCQSLIASISSVQFARLVKILHKETILRLKMKDNMSWLDVILVWQTVVKTDMDMAHYKVCSTALKNLFETIHLLQVPEDYWLDFIRLSYDIIKIKQIFVCDDILPLIMITSLTYLKIENISCDEVFDLCKSLLKDRKIPIVDNLPSILLLYRNLIQATVQLSNCTTFCKEAEYHSFDIEEIANLLIKLKKEISPLSVYLIADLLKVLTDNTLRLYLKRALQNSIYCFLSICNQHGIALLSRTLPTSLQEVFKVQLNIFNKFHKYSGEI